MMMKPMEKEKADLGVQITNKKELAAELNTLVIRSIYYYKHQEKHMVIESMEKIANMLDLDIWIDIPFSDFPIFHSKQTDDVGQ